jgi:hypothetical protein
MTPPVQLLYIKMKKIYYIYTMLDYSDIRNEIVSFAGKWMELEIMMLIKQNKLE